MIQTLFSDYIDFKNDDARIYDKFHMPSTAFRLHLMELDDNSVGARISNFYERVNSRVETLKSRKSNWQGRAFSSNTECLYTLINLLRNQYCLGSDQNLLLLRDILKSENVDLEDIYSCIYKSVFDGEIDKRKFRIHLDNIEVPFSILREGKIHTDSLSLKSLSKEALLFSISESQMKDILLADHCSLSISTNEIFKCYDERVFSEVKALKPEAKNDDTYCTSRKTSQSLDLKEVKFYNCHVSFYEKGNVLDLPVCMYVPFFAMYDDLLFNESGTRERMARMLDQLEDCINTLLTSKA